MRSFLYKKVVGKFTAVASVVFRVHDRCKSVSQGFTLIEILIASTIFALVMIFTTATISQTTGFQAKIRELRRTSDDVRRISNNLSDDIKAVRSTGSAVLLGTEYIKGSLMLRCTDSGVIQNCTTSSFYDDQANNHANVLILFTGSDYTVYLSRESGVFRKKISGPVPDGVALTTALNSVVYNASGGVVNDNRISDVTLGSSIDFYGYSCPKIITYCQQPYVKFYITSQTADYNNLPANQRAQASIRSVVAVRNYD